MKMKTKKRLLQAKYVAVYMAALAVLSEPVAAKIIAKRTGPTGQAGKTSADVKVTQGKAINEAVDIKEGTASVSCKQDPDSAKYFPLDFFQSISRDGSTLSFEKRPDNKIMVKIPASLDSCGKFKPQLYQDPATKNVTVFMQTEDGKSYSQYLSCLEEKKILVDGAINHDEIKGDQYSEYSYVLDYSFDKAKDLEKSLKLSFGYPKNFAGKDGYPVVKELDPAVELPSSLCMVAEKIELPAMYLHEGKEAILSKINEACSSKNADRIAEVRKTLGNAEVLKDIAAKVQAELDDAYLVAVKAQVKKIYEDMQAIDERLTKERDTIDEASAKKLTKKYAELAKELDRIYLNPALMKLDNLLKEAANLGDDSPRKEAINAEVKKLNEEVGAFAAKKDSFAPLYFVMEKYSIAESAKTIEDIRAKSFFYGKVYSGPEDKRGKPITFEQANQEQYNRMQKFDKVLSDWQDQYLVGKGSVFPIQKTEKERAATYDKMNKRWYDFQVQEQKKYQQYCGVGFTGAVKNPIQCQAFQAGAKQRMDIELKKRNKDLLFIKSRNEKLGKMGINYADYQRRQVANETAAGYDDYGSSYTSYEDNFEDRFPGYYGAQAYTPYDPSMYSMGGQNAAMNMGNNMMYNPQMINPQMPVMQGQYQMQAGAWPSM